MFALLFVGSAFGHFKNTAAMAGYAQSKGVPAPKLAVQGSGLLILVGAVLVATGYQAALGALLLVIFLIPTAFLMHPFWKETDAMAKMSEQVNFLKDISLAGAAFLVLADLGARTLLAPAELPIGVLTAFVGAPFFLFVLRARRLQP